MFKVNSRNTEKKYDGRVIASFCSGVDRMP